MPKFLKVAALASVLAMGLVSAGCGGNGGDAPAGPKVKKIGAVLPMFNHPFFVAQMKALESEAREQGVSIEVREGQDNDEKQLMQVELLVSKGCDAIILCPRDSQALIPAVEKANSAGIPILTMNRRVEGGKVFGYVGADDKDGGRSQAETLVKMLGSQGGKILYLQGTQGSSPQRSRQEGFLEVLKNHPEIVIAADKFADFQEDKSKEIMTGLVERFAPGEIRAIVAQSDEMALPAAEVARQKGWKDVVIIGFDGTKLAFDAIKAGHMNATILQDAGEQGRLAVALTVKHLKGETVPQETLTKLPVVTKENVDALQPGY